MKLFLFSQHFPGLGSCPSPAAHLSAQRGRTVKSSAKTGCGNRLESKTQWPTWRQVCVIKTTSQQQGLHQLSAFSSLSQQDLSWRWDFHQHKGHLEHFGVKSTELGQPQPSWGDTNTKVSSDKRRLRTEHLSSPQGFANSVPIPSLPGLQSWPSLPTGVWILAHGILLGFLDTAAISSWKVSYSCRFHCRFCPLAFPAAGMVLRLCCSFSLSSCALSSRFPKITDFYLFTFNPPLFHRYTPESFSSRDQSCTQLRI